MSSVDSKALFDMAVDKGSHELASLAWKISVAKPARKPHAVRRGRPVAAPSVWEGPEALIEELHKSQSYWSIGAAMLITYLGDSDDWSTLRKIGVHFVNNLGSSELGTARMPDNSVLYKGFTWNDEKMEFEPLDYRAGIDRKQTFHVSRCTSHSARVSAGVCVTVWLSKNLRSPTVRRIKIKTRRQCAACTTASVSPSVGMT